MALRKFTGISNFAFGAKQYQVPEDGIVEIETEVVGDPEFTEFCKSVNAGEGTSVEVIEALAPVVEAEAPKAKPGRKPKADAEVEAEALAPVVEGE